MIEIIPAIDIIGGKCVRLTEGDFRSIKIYDNSPVEMAVSLEAVGVKRLHVVDLDGAKVGHPANLTVVELISSATDLKIDLGGGIKTDDDIKAAFDAGAQLVSIGSAAVRTPDTVTKWLREFGPEKILLGADVRERRIAIDGWKTLTEIDVIDFLRKWKDLGVREAFVTDISKDGALAGPGIDLYQEVIAAVPELKIVASGGITSLEDIDRLEEIGCSGIIVGKAIYEGHIGLEELSKYAG